MTPNGRVANKVALVTDCRTFVGQKEGGLVADIAAETGQQVVDEINRTGGKAAFLALDVTQEAAWQDVTERILHDFAKLDIAVNNAGMAVSRSVNEMTLAEWRRVLHINLDGVFLGT
jgi:NAD(P)-dependent dehydrogenase (short-subunit alcohol dehydrogenase family)